MDLQKTLRSLISEFGATEVSAEFRRQTSSIHLINEATIIANAGLHSFPDEILRGEIFEFTHGMLDFSTKEKIEIQISRNILRLSGFLKSSQWRNISIITSGHPVISMQIKLAVYRLTRIETRDWLYDGKGNYFEISIPVRELMTLDPNQADL